MVTVKLSNGSVFDAEPGQRILDLLTEHAPEFADKAVAAKINEQWKDLTATATDGDQVEIVFVEDPEGLEILRHTTSHVLAQAVLRLFPGAKLAIGPATKDGFYYDIDLSTPIHEEDLSRIEEEMRKIIAEDLEIRRVEMSRQEAIKQAEAEGNSYKKEILEDLEDQETVSFYEQGEFCDLCRGPHLPSTGRIKAFKLLSVAGAYWRGDERNPMLQRIYGTAFPSAKELRKHLQEIEEAKKRDHRKLGRELGLYGIYEESGPGLVFFLPKGMAIRLEIENFLRREHTRRGYQIVLTPHLLQAELWKISGHYQMNYPMYYTEIEDKVYGIKPMNCPGHILMYRDGRKSYRDMPVRMFELGTVYRHEKSGTLHGLLRVRGFTQDDAHIFCTPDQLSDEILGALNFACDMMNTFGFEFVTNVGTRPDKSIGSDEDWERATSALIRALEKCNLPYNIVEKDGAFYGPKIDIALLDALGRPWDGPTIQVDFAQPERFDLSYVGSDGELHRPVMIHRTVLGSLERFIGCLIEHYAGDFPLWLAPIQARILPISEKQLQRAQSVYDMLREKDFRVELDARNEKIGYRIRAATVEKIPYMLVIGDREVESGKVSVRSRKEGDLGVMDVKEIADLMAEKIRSRSG